MGGGREGEESQGDVGGGESTALSLSWSFGICGPVESLQTATSDAVVYAASHTGVIFFPSSGKSKMLQGHCNAITALAVSADKAIIATADTGPGSLLVLWNAETGVPIRTAAPKGHDGILSLTFSPDCSLLASMSAPSGEDRRQALCVWAVQSGELLAATLVPPGDEQHCVSFRFEDTAEIVTNGKQRVFFWSWSAEEVTTIGAAAAAAAGARESDPGEAEENHLSSLTTGSIRFYSPPVHDRDFKQKVGEYVSSVFLPGPSMSAITGTVDGDLVVWEVPHTSPQEAPSREDRRATKVLRILPQGLSCLTRSQRHFFCGGTDGCIRVFNSSLGLVTWMDDLDSKPIMSMGISAKADIDAERENTTRMGLTDVKDEEEVFTSLVLGTEGNRLLLVDGQEPEEPPHILIEGPQGGACALAAHPSKNLVASIGELGVVQVWDVQEKCLLLEEARKEKVVNVVGHESSQPDAPSSIAGVADADSSEGTTLCYVNESEIAAGHKSGHVRFLDSTSLKEVQHVRMGVQRITHMCSTSSPAGDFLALSDASRSTTLLMREAAAEGGRGSSKWEIVGKHRAHSGGITGITFTSPTDDDDGEPPRLFSIGEDCRLVEYALEEAAPAGGLFIRRAMDLTTTSMPCAILALPGEIIISDSDHKIRSYAVSDSATEPIFKSTILGPTFGGPICQIVSSGRGWTAFASREQAVGIGLNPLDGYPGRCIALIAHPGEVSSLTILGGSALVTASAIDGTISLWNVDEAAFTDTVLQDEAEAAAAGVSKYATMLEGGCGGEVHEELLDYFYYAQVRAQGEATSDPRRISNKIPIQEIPGLMRALGYYPSIAEVSEIMDEACQGDESVTGIDLETFLKLYTNHRPLYGISEEELHVAFEKLGANASTGQLTWEVLKAALMREGEPMAEEELAACLDVLLDEEEQVPSVMDANEFSSRLLGFEDDDEAEEA